MSTFDMNLLHQMSGESIITILVIVILGSFIARELSK